MEEHEVAAMACDLPQGQPEVSGAGTASGWGTCEELLLVSAVKRHGVHNWNLISSELKARAISLNVSPLHFSETVCKHKYDALRGRYASSSSSSMSQVEEVENDMQWFEELRKLRVAHLKRELEQYDGSIGSLQVKIKRLKAEKAQDSSLNKQLGKSIANPRSIHDMSAATSSCEVSEQLMTGLRPCSSPQQAVTALDSETTPYEQATSQAATSSQKEVIVTDTDQWHDSVEEFQETSPVSTVITVDLDVQTDPHPCGNTAQHNSTEHEEIQDNAAIFVGKEVATEPPVLVGVLEPGDGLESVEADSNEERKEFMKLPENELADSHQQDKHMVDKPAEFLPKDNEAGGIGPDSRNDGDNKKAGILEDLKICEELSSEVEVVEDDGSVNAQVDYERSRYSTAAIPVSITDTGIDGCDSEHGNHQDCSTIHSSMTSSMCLLPNSSQSPESRTPDEAGEPHSKVSITEEEATTSLDDGQNVSELHEGETLEEDGVNETPVEVVNCPLLKALDLEGYGGSQPHVVVALDTVDGHSSRVVESSTLNHGDVENTNNVYKTDVRKEHKIEDPEVTETPDDDVGRCTGRDESDRVTSQEQDLQSEVPNVGGDVMDPNVLKDTTILDPGSTEAGQSLDDIAAGEHVQINNEPQKLEISAIVPVTSLVSSESGVIRDGTIILLNNSDPKGNVRSPAGLVYLSDALSVDRKSLSPERHIIIALDEPSNDVLSCRGRPVLASNVGGQVPCKMGSYTGSEAPDADNKKLLLENLNWSLGSNGNEAETTSPANAMDLLREVYGTAHETTSESTIPSSTEGAATTNPSSTTLSAEAIIPDTQKAYSGDQTLLETSTKATYQLRNSVEMHVPSKDAGKDEEENDLSFAGDKEPCYAGVGQLEAGDPYKVSPSLNGEESALPNLVLSLPEEECLQQVDGDSTIDPLGIRPTTANREDEPTDQKFAMNNEERELPGIIIDVKLDIISKDDDDDDAYDITTSDSKHSRVVSSDSLKGTSALKNTTNALKCRDGVEAKEEPKEEIVQKSKSHAQDSREGLLPHSIVIPKLEPSSPVESSAGGLESKIPSSHEGSDSVHEQYKDSGDERRQGGTRNYGESHVFDKSEAGSPIDGNDAMSPSSRSNRKEPRVPGKLVPLLEVLRRLCSHKSAYLFKGRQEVRKNPLASQSLSKDSRYNLLIRRHLDLTIVRARLEEGAYSSGSKEFFRDLLLIFNNAMVYYPCGSVEFEGAKSLFAEATKEMERIFQTEALLNRDGPATRTRELKKPKTVVGVVAVPAKTVGGPLSGGASSGGKLVNNPIPPVTSLPETNNRKRAGSRLGAVETSTNSGAAVESEGGAVRSASVNPKVRSTTEEEAGNLQEDDQEVDGRLNDTKKLHKVGVLSRGKPPREELLEGILLKNAGGNKGTGRGAKVKDVKVLKEVKKEEVLKKVAVPAKVAAVGAKPKADKGGERVKVRVSEKEQRERDKEKGKEREDIDDDDVLRRGKSLSKVKDREVVIREREPEVIKPALKARASTAARPTSNNSRDTLAQSLVRPSRGGRKSAVEPSRPLPELQPKKRVRK